MRRSFRARSFSRRESSTTTQSGLQFYRNRQLELYASKETKRLSLRQLVFFGRAMDKDRLIQSANYVRGELPVRIAHRIRDMQALPYVVVTQESVAQVYELYWEAFEKFRRFPPINNLEQNAKFCDLVRGLLNDHYRVIPSLSLGLSLSSRHLSPEQLDAFMRRMLVSRISRRVLAEHHIALSASVSEGVDASPNDHVGIIYTNLSVKDSLERCVKLLEKVHEAEDPTSRIAFPNITVDGHEQTRFSYIKEHLDYIVFELLNNAIRFTKRRASTFPSSLPPTIRATIVASTNDIHLRISDVGGGLSVRNPQDLYSFSHIKNATRLRDERLGALRSASSGRGGWYGTVSEQIARLLPKTNKVSGGKKAVQQAHSTNEEAAAVGGRIGLGLPMSNIYATYFGGSLDLVSLDGWGTDVYLRLPKLGTNLEGVEV